MLPRKIEGFDGVTAIDARMGAVTVRIVVELIAPDAARIVVPPAATPVASPLLLMVAMFAADELHVAELVRFCVLPSV